MVTLSLGKKKKEEEEQEERREGVQLSLAPRKTYTYTDDTGRSFSQQDIVKEDLRRREKLDAYDRALQEEIKKRSQAADWRSNYMANKDADEEMRRDSAPEGDAILRQRRAEAYENTSPARQYAMAREARMPEVERFYQSQRSEQLPSTLEDVRRNRTEVANFLSQAEKPDPQATAAWRADRDSLIDRFSRGMEAVSDVSSRSNMPGYMATPEDQQILKNWQETLLEVERRGGIENLARMQENDAANDRRYGAALRGVNPDEMSFFEKAGNVIGGVFSGAGKQTLASAVGTYQGLQNANMMKAEEGISEGLKQVVNHYLGALARDPEGKEYGTQSLRASILKQAGVIGGEDYANRLMRYIDDKVASTRAAVPDAGFGDFYAGLDLNSVERYSDTAWRNLNKIAGSEDVYKTMFALQDSAAADTQRAKDVLQSDFGDKLVDAATSAVQSRVDALISMSMGLSGTGLLAMVPFAARAFGGSVAEASRAVMNRGEVIGKDMARRINRSANISASIEVGTEMLWGSVGAMGFVTGGGALDEAITKRLSSALSRMAKTDTGARILSNLGKTMLGGGFEGLEEKLADGLNWLFDTAGMYGEDRGTLEEMRARSNESFITGMLSGWMGEVGNVAIRPMQNAQLGRAIRGDANELNNMAEAALASDGQLGRTFENIALKRGLDFDSGQSMAEQANRLSNRELGKIYRSYEDTLNNEGVSDIYRAVDRVKDGKELSERDVNRIVRNEEALQYLEDVTGKEINREDVTGSTIEALEGLASRQEALNTEQGENVQEERANPLSTPQQARRADEATRRWSPGQELQSRMDMGFAGRVMDKAFQIDEALNNVGIKENFALEELTKAYNPKQNAVEYAGEAMRFYTQAMSGTEFNYSAAGENPVMTEAQARIAYNVGQYERNYGTEANNEGTDLRVRESGERIDGQGAGGQVGGMAKSTRQNQGRVVKARPADRGAASVIVGTQEVTAKDLGLPNGTDVGKAYVVTGNYSEDMEKGRRMAEENGLEVVYYAKGNGSGYLSDDMDYFPAVKVGNRIIVRADDPIFTASQFVEHECTHKDIDDGRIDVDQIWDERAKDLSGEELDRLAQMYAETFVYEDKEGNIRQLYSTRKIKEEIVCDAKARMNTMRNATWQKEAAPIYEKVRKAAVSNAEKNAGRETRGQPEEVSYSRAVASTEQAYREYVASMRSRIENNRPVWYSTSGERSKQAQEVIRKAADHEHITLDEVQSIPELLWMHNYNQSFRDKYGVENSIDIPGRRAKLNSLAEKAYGWGSYDKKTKKFTGSVATSKHPRLDIVIGLPGSGKSSVYTNDISSYYKSRVLDTDDFRDLIDIYDGVNSSFVHEEASEIRDLVKDYVLSRHQNVILSILGKDIKQVLKNAQRFVEEGYDIYLHLNDLSVDQSIGRSISRFIKKDGSLGRAVDPANTIRIGNGPVETYIALTGQKGKYENGQRITETDGVGRRQNPSDRRQDGRRRAFGEIQETSGGIAEIPRWFTAALKGYDWFNNDVERGQDPIYYSEYSYNGGAVEAKGMDGAVETSHELDSDGNTLSVGQVNYFKDSKVRDENGNLLVMYHGTEADFTVFDVLGFGGKNGTADGYGIYYTDQKDYASIYGGKVMSGYLNVKKPAYRYKKTIKRNELMKLIKESCLREAEKMVEDGEYDSVADALRDTWVSNYEYTPGARSMESVYSSVVNTILQGNDNDADIIYEIMNASGNAYNYSNAMDFLNNVLTPITGIDGIWAKYDQDNNVVVTFNSNQFKNTDNTNPTENPDIRYSRAVATPEQIELLEANRQLKKDLSDALQKLKARTEQRDKWRRETQVTKGRQVRMDDAKRLAKTLLKEHSSKADADALAKKVKDLSEFCLNFKEFDDAFLEEAWMKSYEIAHMILEETEILNEQGGETFYKDLRDYLRGTQMYVPPSVQKDLTPDKWNDYRKSLFGTMNLSAANTSAMGIDVAYQELQEKFGESLFPDDITNPADQVRRMLEIVETYKPVYENWNSYAMADAVEWTANEILTRVVGEEMKQTSPTYADRMEKRLAEQKEKTQQALQKVRQQRDDKVAKLKQHYQDVAEEKRARRIDSQQRTKLLNMIRRLNNKKLPRVQRALLDQYIGDIDTVAKSITGKTVKNLEALRDWYKEWSDRQKAELGEDFVPDSYIEGLIERLEKKRINDLTQEEVANLITVLMNFETMIRTENEFIDSQERRDTYAAALDMVSDYKNSKARTNKELSQSLQGGLLSPERYAHRLADYNDNNPLYKLTKELSGGQRRMFDYRMRAENLFKEWVNDKKFIKEIAGKDAKWVTVKGIVDGELQDVEITPAMRMSLYLHAKSEDNLNHVESGGVLIPNKDLYKKGKMDDAYKEGIGKKVKFSRYMIHEIAKDMSAKERAFADAAFKLYFNSMSKDAINEVSLQHVGYEIAKVLQYFPIDTSRDFLKADFGEMKQDGTVAGAGFLKERLKNASAPIMLYDMNSVLTKSIDAHSKYYGLALPVRNMNKLLNVKFLDNSGSVRNNLLSSHTKYLDKIIRDVQTGVERSDDSFNKFISLIRHNYAGGVLALNAGVAVKQAASYPTAAAIIGYRPLIKALKDSNKKVDLDMISKYTPLLWYRSLGYGTAELGDIAKRGGVAADMMSHKALNWIQTIDVATTTKLWTAAEYYVIERMAAGELDEARLKSDLDAFHKEVAKVYNRIIEETQPNYAAMQRPGILRSASDTVRALNMFKTQPFQNANILYDAFGNMNAKARQAKANPTEENLKALKDARKAAARAVTSQALSAFTFSFMQFIWDMVRGKTKKYKDDEDEMNFWSVNRALGLNILTSLGGMVPFGGTILEMAESWIDKLAVQFGGDPIFDQKFYGLSDNALEAANDLAQTVMGLSTDIIDVFQGKTTAETSARTIVDKVASLVLTTTGIPAENIIKDFRALAVNAGRVKGKIDGDPVLGPGLNAEYNSLRVTTDPAKYKSDYYALLRKAWSNDKSLFNELRQKYIDMAGDPFATSSKSAAENIDAKIKEWEKERIKQDNQSQKPKDNLYNRAYDGLTGSKLWEKASNEQQDKVLEKLLDMALAENDPGYTKSGAKDYELYESGKSVGIDETEYMLFQLALSMANPDGGSPKNSEITAAVEMIPGLTDAERSYLWGTKNDNPKNNPWKR